MSPRRLKPKFYTSPTETEFLDCGIRFFIPHTKKSLTEASYQDIIAAVKEQLKVLVTPRRIRSLTYHDNRRRLTACVGEREEMEGHYEVVAILEANMYIIVTRSPQGHPGPSILVGAGEAAQVVSFK